MAGHADPSKDEAVAGSSKGSHCSTGSTDDLGVIDKVANDEGIWVTSTPKQGPHDCQMTSQGPLTGVGVPKIF